MSAGPRPHNARDLRSANRPDRERSPEIDEDVKGDELDRVTRAQVRNLEERSAEWVAKHLVMAGRLIDFEPELAFQHALAASRRGGRLAAVREAVGLTAYAAGHYGEALREFRTFRRISGSNVHLPVMADCERGLGRPDRALDLARSEEAESLDATGKAELAMVVSGARADLGQLDAAVAALEIPQLDLHRAFSFSPRLFRAYADALDAVGRSDESGKWRRQAGVAEKALGLDDDLEPDIVDLGEDDEPAPVTVPKVGDLLGRAAAAPAADPAGDAPVQNGDAPVQNGDAPAQNCDAPAQNGDVPAQHGQATDTSDAETPDGATDDTAEGLPDPDGDADGDADADGGPGLPLSTEGAEPEAAGDPADDTEETERDGGEAQAVPVDAVPVDAVPVGETAHPVQSLQTEMLFSMDESGAADIAPSGDDGSADERRPSAGPAVEFSEAGSSPAGHDAGIGEQAGEQAGGEADARERAGKAEASQDDVVDD
ncbi:hypothetical protein [Arthrobacter burdickii]|uniref:TPR-repeat-containing protein n=1 Tax=Arthrobacter burdickii TaxID=3035920 RepID=A0ABT8K5L4_9MICC|nr:hypothetical protein [Arthrobacter burdickii]MDN4612106.1 hypothetical protein [Arthrobacter burdickii]